MQGELNFTRQQQELKKIEIPVDTDLQEYKRIVSEFIGRKRHFITSFYDKKIVIKEAEQ
jgi:hypothetical protein